MSLATESREMLHYQSHFNLSFYHGFLKDMLASGAISKNSCLIDAYNSAPTAGRIPCPPRNRIYLMKLC